MTRLLLALAAAFLAACSAIDPYNMIGRQFGEASGLPTSPVPDTNAAVLDVAARQRAFDFVWGTIHERYHDPKFNGVDWDAVGARYRPLAMAAANDEAFWDVLDRMAGELRDSHTRVESPARVELRKRDEQLTLGFSFIPLEGRLVVSSVGPDSDAWWSGVRSGMTVVEIGGEPAAAAYEKLLAATRLDSTARSRHQRALRRLVGSGTIDTTTAFVFERADGTRIGTNLARRRLATRADASWRVLPSGFGYLRLNQWTLGATARAIDGVRALKDTPGLVIDLRGNPGGSVHAVNEVLSRFFVEPADLGRVTTRTGRPVSVLFGAVDIVKLKSEVPGSKDAYAAPVAILLNAGSASGSELFAGTMQASGRAVVVGDTSCGCLLGFLGYARVPGGAELAYSEVGFVLANGQHIEGAGVIPNHPVPASVADLRASRDRALETAQEVLAAMTAKRTGG
jgi:carboxyl-terminal processing protease